MLLVTNAISIDELKKMSEKMFGGLVKAVVDIKQECMVVDADMHVDQEQFLLDEGAKQGDLWGINIFPEKVGTKDFVVFDSMINLRPGWGNKSRSVDCPKTQEKIRSIVERLVVQ